jgi:hypothetical protein
MARSFSYHEPQTDMLGSEERIVTFCDAISDEIAIAATEFSRESGVNLGNSVIRQAPSGTARPMARAIHRNGCRPCL